jgi:hypothetical protein
MASERQIAANRHNANKSTGSRSASGRKQPSQNALCHGLARPASADFEAQIETLARQSLKIQLTPQDLHLRALRRNQTRIVAIVPCATSENGKMIARSLIFGALESTPVTFVPTLRKFGGSLPSSNG